MSTLADRFFELHARNRIFVLPNAWDAASAAVLAREGFPAIATTSAGMANSLGYADGECVDTDALFAAIARVTRVVDVPVSADLEAGFGISAEAAVLSLERAIDAGVVGANFEDYDPRACDVIPIKAHAERIRAIKERAIALGVRFFVNARTDVLLHGIGDEATQVDRTIERLRAYVSAGADGVFAPGVSDAPTIERIARAVGAPLNVLAGAQTPPVAELERCGVTRVTVGSLPMRRTLGVLREIARELKSEGTFRFTADQALTYDEANALFPEAPER